ncbi:hypothetical protein DSECCO2_603010 [anaerobic digester metagenome]
MLGQTRRLQGAIVCRCLAHRGVLALRDDMGEAVGHGQGAGLGAEEADKSGLGILRGLTGLHETGPGLFQGRLGLRHVGLGAPAAFQSDARQLRQLLVLGDVALAKFHHGPGADHLHEVLRRAQPHVLGGIEQFLPPGLGVQLVRSHLGRSQAAVEKQL